MTPPHIRVHAPASPRRAAQELEQARAAMDALPAKTITIRVRPDDPTAGVPAQVGGPPPPHGPGGRAEQTVPVLALVGV